MIIKRIKKIITKPLSIFLAFTFFVCSWPFISFPLTDGDVSNWMMASYKIQKTGVFLKAVSDQGHGPLMAWTGAIFAKLTPHSFYAYNFFNLLCGLLGVYLVYFFTYKFWQKKDLSILATYIFCTNIAVIYLTRTPMYDWPAAIMYFMFCGFYYLYVKENEKKYLIFSLIAIGVGSLSRFSICWGLAGIFMLLTSAIYRRSIKNIILDSLFITLIVGLFNFPWLISQTKIYGSSFIKTFLFDNTGRYMKSARPDAHYRKDFYGFLIYALVGMIPHTFCLIASLFQKGITKRFKDSKESMVLLAGFLPCLILFSFSGHTKLARYIAYVFPFISMLTAYFMYFYDLKSHRYRKKCRFALRSTAVLLIIILVCLVFQFNAEVKESIVFALSVIVLLFSLLGVANYTIKYRYKELLENATKYLGFYFIIYFAFFSLLSFLYKRAEFLIDVEAMIRNVMQ